MAMAPSSLALKSFRNQLADGWPRASNNHRCRYDYLLSARKPILTDPEKQILSLQVTVV